MIVANETFDYPYIVFSLFEENF